MKKHVFLILVILALTGCGGPSTSEIRDAVQTYDRAQLAKQLAELQLPGKQAATVAIKISLPSPKDLVVDDLKRKHLKELDDGNYSTRVSYTLRVGDQTEKVAAEIILSPTKNGWSIVSSLPL